MGVHVRQTMLDDTLRRPEHQLDTPAVECAAGLADLPAKLGRKAVPIAACRSNGDSLGRAIMGLLDRFRSNRGLSLAGAPPRETALVARRARPDGGG